MTFEEFESNQLVKDAVLRNLEVLGEAAKRVPDSFKDHHPEIEWGRIIRSRNVIIHDYEIIDYKIIWRIITIHLPPLKVVLEKILKAL
jgi:uncharacterized protein with HEPN domain